MEITHQRFTEERALFGSENLILKDCEFDQGESPMKETRGLKLEGTTMKWKYPLWYSSDIEVSGGLMTETARAGIWYTDNIRMTGTTIEAPKTFRRSRGISLTDVRMTNASETLWMCSDVKLRNCYAKGDYLLLNSTDLTVDGLELDGNYAFDGARNAQIKNSRLLTKDAFWNSENVTVSDSYISGEYFGWNSRNLTLIRCTIESLQGLCYIDNLRMIDCRLEGTSLAFEYSSVEAEISSSVDSVLNPKSGIIRAGSIGELILERDRVDPGKTVIVCSDIRKTSEKPDWGQWLGER